MKQSSTSNTTNAVEEKLPRRDWILLPVLGLLTVGLLAVSAESAARWLFPVSEARLGDCFVTDDPIGDARPKPNSNCSERIAESRFDAQYTFNGSGHRAGMEEGPKAPGTYRIVMLGSSLGFGLFVPREKTFAGLLPAELSNRTGRKVELYNEARGGKFRGGPFPTRNSAQEFNEVLEAKPDMILWVVTPKDIANPAYEDPTPATQSVAKQLPQPIPSGNSLARALNHLGADIAAGTLWTNLLNHWDQTRTSVAMKHFLYGSESPDQYVKSYLGNKDDASFLKAEPSAEFVHMRRYFEVTAAEFARQSRAAGVPLVAVLVPNRAQAAMISTGQWPAGYDPYKVGDELRSIIESDGGTYIDILPDYRKVPSPEQHYFPVDGHPDAEGHAMIAAMLTQELTAGAVPALKAPAQPQNALAQGR